MVANRAVDTLKPTCVGSYTQACVSRDILFNTMTSTVLSCLGCVDLVAYTNDRRSTMGDEVVQDDDGNFEFGDVGVPGMSDDEDEGSCLEGVVDASAFGFTHRRCQLLPCSCIKSGHFECLERSRRPLITTNCLCSDLVIHGDSVSLPHSPPYQILMLLVSLKNVLRKVSTTKAKALEDLISYVQD